MFIDVIIPCYNQYESLKITLDAFAKQNTDHEFRLIIIDDGSTDILSYDMDELCHGLKYTYVKQENTGRSAARNAGIRLLQGDYVIFNDCDRPPAPSFIDKHISMLKRSRDFISIGSPKEIFLSDPTRNYERIMQIVNGNNTSSRMYRYALKIDKLFDEEGNTNSALAWLSTYSGNIGMSTTVIEKEYFDTFFSSWGLENLEWGYRLINDGYIFKRTYDAINFHIAHRRGANFYDQSMINNHRYFYEKHSTTAVMLLYDFMTGVLSLQDYEKQVSEFTCIPETEVGIYFKVGGLS